MHKARAFFAICAGLLCLLPVVAGAQAPAYLYQWGTYGTGGGQFISPFGIAVDASGRVYVADGDNYRIQVFTSSGTYLTQWGTQGSGPGQFLSPYGVAVDGERVYVSDRDNCRIQVFTSSGEYLTQWSLDTGAVPHGVALDRSGNVYVADIAYHRIQVFTGSGAYLTQWGTYGTGDGQFYYPYGVAVDASGHVYVTDKNNCRIQVFGPIATPATHTTWGSVKAKYATPAPVKVTR